MSKSMIFGFIVTTATLVGSVFEHGKAFALTFGHDNRGGVMTLAKVTEIGLHRMDHLVDTGRLDITFRTALKAVYAERTNESGATFKVVGVLAAGKNGQSSIHVMLMNEMGKVVTESSSPLVQPDGAFNWPQASALELIESSLHYVLDNQQKSTELQPFFNDFSTVVLNADQDSQLGGLIAVAQITRSADTNANLFIKLKINGVAVSHEIR